MLGSTLAMLQYRMVDALNEVMPGVSSVCQHHLPWAGMCLVPFVSLWEARRYLCWKLKLKSEHLSHQTWSLWWFYLATGQWRQIGPLQKLQSKELAWGGRADPSISSKSRNKESPAALGRLTVVLKAFHAQPQEGCWNSKDGVDCDRHLWIVSDCADYNRFI